MLKKVLAASVVLAVCLCAVAVAGDPAGKIEGTITRVDMDQKVLVVKDANGATKTVYWDAATKVSGGDLKEGATVSLSAADQQGKMVASSIQVGDAAAPKKPY